MVLDLKPIAQAHYQAIQGHEYFQLLSGQLAYQY